MGLSARFVLIVYTGEGRCSNLVRNTAIAHRAPYQSASGISISQSLDYQVLDLIVQAGADGIIKNVSCHNNLLCVT